MSKRSFIICKNKEQYNQVCDGLFRVPDLFDGHVDVLIENEHTQETIDTLLKIDHIDRTDELFETPTLTSCSTDDISEYKEQHHQFYKHYYKFRHKK